LSEYDQAPKQDENKNDWQEPEFFPLFHESPQFREKFAHGHTFGEVKTDVSYERVIAAAARRDTYRPDGQVYAA